MFSRALHCAGALAACGMMPSMNPPSQRRPVQRLGLWLGAAIFAAMLILPEPAGFLPTAWRAAALTLLMAVWWATGALPIAATSILPLAAGPCSAP